MVESWLGVLEKWNSRIKAEKSIRWKALDAIEISVGNDENAYIFQFKRSLFIRWVTCEKVLLSMGYEVEICFIQKWKNVLGGWFLGNRFML